MRRNQNRPALYEDEPSYRIDMWDDEDIRHLETLAYISDLGLAKHAFAFYCLKYRHEALTLRQGARVIDKVDYTNEPRRPRNAWRWCA